MPLSLNRETEVGGVAARTTKSSKAKRGETVGEYNIEVLNRNTDAGATDAGTVMPDHRETVDATEFDDNEMPKPKMTQN